MKQISLLWLQLHQLFRLAVPLCNSSVAQTRYAGSNLRLQQQVSWPIQNINRIHRIFRVLGSVRSYFFSPSIHRSMHCNTFFLYLHLMY